MTRRYVQRARADAAQRTRERILETAREALVSAPRLDFNVGEIGASAGVARSTIYAAFGSRSGLLAAVANDALERAGLPEVIAEYRRPDPVEAVERSLRASCRMYAREQPVFARLLVLAAVDPDAAAPISRSQADRAMGMSVLAGRLAAAGRLRAGLTEARAADILWLATGFWAFDDLFSGRGLDAEAVAEALVRIVRSTVLAAGDEASPGGPEA
jgi:AcrR family transcriptional regulator